MQVVLSFPPVEPEKGTPSSSLAAKGFTCRGISWSTAFSWKPQKTTIPCFLHKEIVRPETEFSEGCSVDITTSPNRNAMSVSLSKSSVSIISYWGPCVLTLYDVLHSSTPAATTECCRLMAFKTETHLT